MNYTFALLIMIVLGAIVGYLLGSVLFAIIISNAFKKSDIRQLGSKNPGFTNTTRAHGKKIGFFVLFLDILKTIIPIYMFYLIYHFALEKYCLPFANNFYNPSIFIYVPGIFCIVGHIFPIYYKFKGGKGVSCYGALCISLSPFIALVGCLIIIISVICTKKMSIGSLIATALIPFLIFIPGINFLYLMYPNIHKSINIAINNPIIYLPLFIVMLLLSSLVIYKHKVNIINLLHKSEKTIV